MSLLTSAGAQLFYKESGSGSPILLIHGTSIDADSWRETYDVLAEQHRVVAYDRRGHSRSREAGAQATGDWSLHVADAVAMIEQLGLAPVTVAGWSAGGNVALKLAIEHPELVRALVLVEPPFEAPRHVNAAFLRAFLRARVLFALGRDRAAFEAFMRFVGTRRGATNTWLDPEFPQRARDVGHANVGGYRAEMSARKGLPSRKEASTIEVPVTVVLGAQSDPWFERMALAAVEAIPHARLERIANANHAFGFTAPRELAAVIGGVAAAVSGRDAAGAPAAP